MGKKLDKFLLLMWKNFLLQRRNPKQAVIEVLAPVLFSSLLIVIRSLVCPESFDAKFYGPFNVSMPVIKRYPTLRAVAWSPESPLLTRIIHDAMTEISKGEGTTLLPIPFGNSSSMESYLNNEISLVTILAGIEFEDALAEAESLPEHVNVTLRFPGELRRGKDVQSGYGQYVWRTNLLFPTYQIAGPRGWDMVEGAEPGYNYEGFLKLQQELSLSIIKHLKQQTRNETFNLDSAKLQMQRFPYPKWTQDVLMKTLEGFVSLIIMLSFVYTCINTVKSITLEKEKQLKESMKIMGLPNWLHWTAWFVKAFVLQLITVTMMVVVLKAKWYPGSNFAVFTNSNPLVIFLLLLLFVCATITFCFAISAFFSKANTAAAMAGMIWFISYFPFSFTKQNYLGSSLPQKLLISLCSNCALAYGLQLAVMFEGMGVGLQWSNVWRTTGPDDNLKLGHVLIMLVVDSISYLLVAVYVEAVFPGDYGVPRPWYFPLTLSYWSGKPKCNEPEEVEDEPMAENEFLEAEPVHLPIGVSMLRLRKRFPSKVGVRGLTLNLYKTQITVLIGHNGAGKTTTMSMLTGMIPPSGGTAIINGHDVRKDTAGVRSSLGLCPQHNILFDQLTVREHIYFYSRLKGLRRAEAEKEADKYVRLLELESKADSRSETLSGGMKRKLSVGVALCGGSKVVFFDEPTAGMDPAARRTLWDLIKSQKEGRTILLTTHFMDEADLLGDRIAIMAGGVLKCCGSSFFLKKKYGAGYNLVMDKSSNCDVGKVTALLQKYIPSIRVESNVGSELTYVLAEDESAVFEPMLRDLENNGARLGVESYGISLTTMGEVFMRVGAQDAEEPVTNNGRASDAVIYNFKDPDLLPNYNQREVGEQKLVTGCSLLRNQFLAMLLKRALSIWRSWYLLLIQISIPILFLAMGIMTGRSKTLQDLPKLLVTLDSYENPVTVVTQHPSNKFGESYMNVLRAGNHTFLDWKDGNLSANIFEKTELDTKTVRMHYICGASFGEDGTITAWFNNEPYHSPPLTLNLVINAILQQEVSADHKIGIFSRPLPFTAATRLAELTRERSIGFQVAFNVGFAMAFASSFYIIFYIRERVSKAKHLQFVSGVDVLVFWGTSFLCDLVMFCSSSLCITLILALFQEDGFVTVEELGRFYSILFCFGFSILPVVYLVSFFTKSASTGFTRMTLLNILTGIAAFITVQIIAAPELNLRHVADALHWVFLVIPHYMLCSGIRDVYKLYSVRKICDAMMENCLKLGLGRRECERHIQKLLPECMDTERSYYDMKEPGIGKNLVYSLCLGVLLIVILVIVEYGLPSAILYKIKPKTSSPPTATAGDFPQDEDVETEKEQVRNATADEIKANSFVMRDLTKYYKKFLAVNGLCLRVNRFECFGLVGVNGAGKTTTFKMMTGDVKISHGEAWVDGLSLKEDMKRVRQVIGYCPQFDALLDDLTARETLKIFGLLRGIERGECDSVAEQLARDFDFHRYLDRKVRVLSGGNRRKLSTALAFIGDPLVIYLDEPTTGMDTATKRYIWKAICRMRDSGKCIILTTHSMEECEALCTRLAIMVNATFMCLGSTQRLKSKFSEGYTLIVKLSKSASGQTDKQELIKEFVRKNFPSSVIREDHGELVTFYVPSRTLSWSKMFGIMEMGKRSLEIEDYSLGQSSLEQVFLTFTKYQKEEQV